jgi:hypothetical protein
VRRGRHELHRLTEVVRAALAVATPLAGDAGFERDTVARGEFGDRLADSDDLPGALVAEDDRALNHILPDPAVFVVVDVGPTDTDIADGNENLVGPRLGAGAVA